jgi:hypothetical protein
MHLSAVYLGRAAGHIAAAIFALYPQPRTSELMWRVPYDNQSRAAGPVGIGHTPQQIASQYKEPVKALKQHELPEKYARSPSIHCSDSYEINSIYSHQHYHQIFNR